MGTITSQITSLTTVYSTVYSGADQRKHQSSASLASVRGIHRFPAQMASNAKNVTIWWRHHDQYNAECHLVNAMQTFKLLHKCMVMFAQAQVHMGIKCLSADCPQFCFWLVAPVSNKFWLVVWSLCWKLRHFWWEVLLLTSLPRATIHEAVRRLTAAFFLVIVAIFDAILIVSLWNLRHLGSAAV